VWREECFGSSNQRAGSEKKEEKVSDGLVGHKQETEMGRLTRQRRMAGRRQARETRCSANE